MIVFGQTLERTRELMKQFQDREIQKEYLAEVDGEFPQAPVVVDQPLGCVSFKLGLNAVLPDTGKPSRTRFERVSFNGQTSIIRCLPLTGRTHQIRVHLRWLGYPIVLDTLYRNPVLWAGSDDVLLSKAELSNRADMVVERIFEVERQSETCPTCQQVISSRYDEELGIRLHALRYTGPGWVYETDPPEWAKSGDDRSCCR